MNTITKLLYVMLLCFPFPLFSQTMEITALSHIGVSCDEYVNNARKTWNINISGNRRLVLDYQVRIEQTWDVILIYSINDSGAAFLQEMLTGSQSGQLRSMFPNGKMRVVFQSDNSVNCKSNPSYNGFNIGISQVTGITWNYDVSGNRTSREITLNSPYSLRSGAISSDYEEEIVFEEKVSYQNNDIKFDTDVRIYPNPTEGLFAVEINGIPEEISGKIYLYDAKGRILDKKETLQDSKIEFDLSQEPPGIYLLSIRLGEDVSTWKIIKK